MDKPGGNEAVKVLKKGKKKHAKDELDRQKQAEKKRRRLEKALANSAAIISALEKKRQQKKEERERQDEEGAAIAEAVALHVLTGEDSDESCHLMLNKHRRCNHWDDFVGIEPTPGSQEVYTHSSGGLTCPTHANFPQWRWTDWGISGTCSSRGQVMDYQAPYLEETFPQLDGCHGFIAAQAVSSLQIGDHSSEDIFPIQGGAAAAVVLNRILSGTNNGTNLYKEL